MKTKNQYLQTLISHNGGYHLKRKKERSKILDEHCRITGQNRKWVIQKIRSGDYLKTMRREKGGARLACSPKIRKIDTQNTRNN